MNVNEAVRLLRRAQCDGKGKFPLQLMIVEDGITYSADIEIDIAPDPADGDRVWIWDTERHLPEWATSNPSGTGVRKEHD